MILLDASAILGYLNDEPGKETIETLLLQGNTCISVVNLAEVMTKLCDWGMTAEQGSEVMERLALRIEPFTPEIACETARLRPLTRELGLSLGDRACLATASVRRCAVVTGDRPWLKLASTLSLEIINFRPMPH